MPLYLGESERYEVRARAGAWFILVLGAFGLLLIRFYVLQVVQNQTWLSAAEYRQIRAVVEPSARGYIFDRNGRLLADWEQSYNVLVTPAHLTEDSLVRLAVILEVPVEELKSRIAKNRSWSPFISTLAAEDIKFDKFAQVEEDRMVMPGVKTEVRPIRKYYADSAAVSHVLGYMGEISRAELALPLYRDYRMGDRVGKTGIERAMESELRGRDGLSYRLVDALDREISSEYFDEKFKDRIDYNERIEALNRLSRPRRPGRSVVLTLDLQFQKAALERMRGHVGSVVVMDVRTGELLVLLSVPGYDPSLFVRGLTPTEWRKLKDDPMKPLFHRAIQGAYSPASVFKMVMAAAGLEENLVTSRTRFNCTGSYEVGADKRRFHCWNRHGHGGIALERAIVESCDVYFYVLGEQMGIETIGRWARNFGLGQRLGIGLLEERAGLIPDREWKLKRRREPWFPGDTINVSIGQGFINMTPLETILIPAAIANNGRLMKPQLIHHLEDSQRRPVTGFQPETLVEQVFQPETARLLRRAMEEAVENPKGTGYQHVRSEVVRIAGKTGTAQVAAGYRGWQIEDIPYRHRDNAWFAAYAPADNPEIAIVVLIEHGGSGGEVAGPVAKNILEDYFRFIRTAGASKK